MATSTTNYGLSKPAVNDATDQDLWGGELNTDLDDIDGLMLTALNWTPSSKSASFNVTAPTAASTTTGSSKILYLCDATAGAIIPQLPTAASCPGMTVAFKKTDVSGNTITITTNGAETIDGATTLVLSAQYSWAIISSDGTHWNILSLYASTTGFAPIANPTFTGVPAAPTAAVNTSTTQLATTAFANPSASIGNSGSVKLPSGLIFKWGTVSAGPSSSTGVTFSAAFATACYVVSVTPSFTGLSALSAVSYGGKSATGFTYYNNNSAATISADWIAIGS